MENLPWHISATFIVTTFVTVSFFLFAIRQTVFENTSAKIFSFVLAFWLLFQAVFGIGGFYLNTAAVPPRLLLFGFVPAFLTIVLYFVFARQNFIEKLPLKNLTLLHIIRIPVEMVLFWLFEQKMIPQLLTFEGRNLDMLSGISAPIVYWLAFRNGQTNRPLLVIWNIIALGLLINVVVNGILSFPSPFQQFAFEQPNRAMMYFPYIWLPTIIVPVVLFAHLISLWQLRSANK